MGQRRLLREFELTKLMLTDRERLRAEYAKLFEDTPERRTDREIIYAIVRREFPLEEPAQHQ